MNIPSGIPECPLHPKRQRLTSAPGAIGVYEAFAVTILKSYGVKPEAALAVALFSHAAQFIPITLVGGVVCFFFPHQNKSNN